MLRDEIELYTKLMGTNGWNVPLVRLGGFIDGYNKGLEVLSKIRAEIEQKARPNELGDRGNGKSIRYGLCMALEIIDKYKESEETDGTL